MAKLVTTNMAISLEKVQGDGIGDSVDLDCNIQPAIKNKPQPVSVILHNKSDNKHLITILNEYGLRLNEFEIGPRKTTQFKLFDASITFSDADIHKYAIGVDTDLFDVVINPSEL